jgi:hypothetical protein
MTSATIKDVSIPRKNKGPMYEFIDIAEVSRSEIVGSDSCIQIIPNPNQPTIILTMTAEIVRRAILKNNKISPSSLVCLPDANPISIRRCSHLIPYGELAEKAVHIYCQSGKKDFEDICAKYLAFAQENIETPGRILIHLLLYFVKRGVNSTIALQHLLTAMTIAASQAAFAPLIPQILNDIGVLALIRFNMPQIAVSFFEQSSCSGYKWTTASIENLRLIAEKARAYCISIPGLREAVKKAEQTISKSEGRGPSKLNRPHPTRDNWSWYLADRNINAAMLCQADGQAVKHKQAADMLLTAFQTESTSERAALMAVAAEILPALEPFARTEQHYLDMRRQSMRQHERHTAFQSASREVQASLAAGDLEQASYHLSVMKAVASTPSENQLIEHFAEDIIEAKSKTGDKTYILANPSTSAQYKQQIEQSNFVKYVAEINRLIKARQYERAIEICRCIDCLEFIPVKTREIQHSRIIEAARQHIQEEVQDSLFPCIPDFHRAENAVALGERLNVGEKFLTTITERIKSCHASILTRQVMEAVEAGNYREAFSMIKKASPLIPKSTLHELTSLVAAPWSKQINKSKLKKSLSRVQLELVGSTPSKTMSLEQILDIIEQKASHKSFEPALLAFLNVCRAIDEADNEKLTKSMRSLIGSLRMQPKNASINIEGRQAQNKHQIKSHQHRLLQRFGLLNIVNRFSRSRQREGLKHK